MKGSEQLLIRFFEGSEKRFVIPLYQRNYDWNEKNCEQLLNDLIALHKQQRTSHFFGSIVSCRADAFSEDRLIIDGQQRITTVSLILISLVNAAKAQAIPCSDPSKIDYIRETYLVDKYQENTRKVKLKPIKKDMEAFDALIYKEAEDYIQPSNVTRNYLYFYNRIAGCGLSLEELLASIKKLLVINITLEGDDDPQLIFESLNSTGMDLSEADKIRNFLLMSFDNATQEHYYNEYWNKIEQCTDYKPTMFIRDYLTVKLRRICNSDILYFEFKDFVASGISREEAMAEMRLYAQYYKQITQAQMPTAELSRKVSQLNNIGSTVAMPFYLQVLKHAQDTGMSDNVLQKVFETIETYWARRILCGLPANALNKVFCVLHYDVMKIFREHERRNIPLEADYAEVLKYVLLRKQGSTLLPGDQELTEQIKTRQIYRMPIDYRYFLFERLENENGKECHDVVKLMKEGAATIEHIMPQTLTPEWQEELGPDYERIHNQYLHTFANLTLTGYNANYSNHSFYDKKHGYTGRKGEHVDGFNDSGYRLNNFLKECDHWNEGSLLKRQQLLSQKILTLWPMPTSNYIPLQRDTDVVSFYDNENLTGRSIVAFIYRGIRHEVISWKEMLLQVCSLVYAENSGAIHELCSKEELFHSSPAEGWSRIAEGCYVRASCSTSTKMIILNRLFDKCGLHADLLEFALTPLPEGNVLIEQNNEE